MMMGMIERTAVVCMLLLAAMSPPTFGAPPMADHVPQDAMAYVGFAGTDDPDSGYDGSITQTLVEQSGLTEALRDQMSSFMTMMEQQQPTAAFELDYFQREILPIALARPWVAYLQPLTLDAAANGDAAVEAPTRLVWLIRPADAQQRQVLRDWLDEMAALAREQAADVAEAQRYTPTVVDHDELLGVVLQPAVAGAVDVTTLGRQAQALGQLPTFASVQGQAKLDPTTRRMVFAWTDLSAVVGHFIEAGFADEQLQPFVQARNQLGLDQVGQMLWTGWFDEAGMWRTTRFIQAPAPRRGLLAALDTPAIEPEQLAIVPRTATWFTAGTWDLPALLEAIRTYDAEQGEDGTPVNIDDAIAQVNRELGFDLESGVVDAVGPLWLAYSDMTTQTLFGTGVCIVNEVRDPEKLEASLLTVQQRLNRELSGPGGPGIRFQTVKSGDVTVQSLGIPMVSPSWAVVDGYLMIALTPQAIASAAVYREQDPEGITAAPTFEQVRRQLTKPASGLMFADLPRSAPQTYQTITTIVNMTRQFSTNGGAGQQILAALPPLPTIMPSLRPAGRASQVNDDGWLTQGVAPFPGSTLLSPELFATQLSPTMLIGVALPAMTRARSAAQQNMSMTQMRGILQGCITYAVAEGDGDFPKDLMVLIDNNYFLPEYLLSPTAPEPLPDDFDAWPYEQQAAWVRQHASYVLIPGLADDLDADRIALFEKPDHSPVGENSIGVAFNDGHVERLLREQVEQTLQEQTGKTMAQLIEQAQAEPAD